ncbi:MAG: sensor histidine kinase [Novosphingobium sp.]
MSRFGFVRSAIIERHAAWYGTAVTLVSVGIATAVRALLGASAYGVPFVTFFPAIMICALLAGWRYGIAAVALSIVATEALFLSADQKFFSDFRGGAIIGLFFISSAIFVTIAETLRRTFVELEASKGLADLLNRELHHRVRNSMGVILAMVHQSARSDPANFLTTFTGRMEALSRAHDLLADGAGPGELGKLIDSCCAPFSHEDNMAVSGPPCLIPLPACVPLTLALHELCTNATKYGALSVPDGRVSIEWSIDAARVARISWVEAGGPPVAPPARKGLGTALLSSPADLGTVDLQFQPDGVRCYISVEGVDPA